MPEWIVVRTPEDGHVATSRAPFDPVTTDALVRAARREPGHRDRGQPQPSRRDEPLVTADDGPILAAREDGLDEAELPEAPFKRVELVLADAAGVGRVRSEVVDRGLVDGEGGEGGR
jgi:hypothetical protein